MRGARLGGFLAAASFPPGAGARQGLPRTCSHWPLWPWLAPAWPWHPLLRAQRAPCPGLCRLRTLGWAEDALAAALGERVCKPRRLIPALAQAGGVGGPSAPLPGSFLVRPGGVCSQLNVAGCSRPPNPRAEPGCARPGSQQEAGERLLLKGALLLKGPGMAPSARKGHFASRSCGCSRFRSKSATDRELGAPPAELFTWGRARGPTLFKQIN